MRHLLCRGLTSGLILVLSAVCHAHPHSWIDLRVALATDDRGRITALHQSWLMDPIYSVLLIEDMAPEARGESLDEKLDWIARTILGNLTEYRYFTEIEAEGRAIAAFQAFDPRLERVGGRLDFRFELRLDEPLDARANKIRYTVYDPTYFIEILHAEQDALRFVDGAEGCESRRIPPRPDPAIVARAAAMAVDQRADPTLGRYFAEWMEVRCPH
ncbi:DUF1007 family protein [Thioalkalicoccus limnaeus]|uniref:DUF1007 family protein n=1 Tax=Thioalkalicoccus limnaeus TaxID=120681 RepID=A0ABV4BD82_9GAMM